MPAKFRLLHIPTDNLHSAPTLVRDIKERLELDNVMVVSPDVGGVFRARALAKRINAPLAIVHKRRERTGDSEVMNIIGDVAGKTCILFGEIIQFWGVPCATHPMLCWLREAEEAYAYITHGVLSGGAVARIAASRLKELVLTDTIQATKAIRVSNNIPHCFDRALDRRSNPPEQPRKKAFQACSTRVPGTRNALGTPSP